VVTQAWELNSNLFRADSQRFLMPTYEYSCEKCGQNFDAFQSMRDEPFRECPKELCRLPEWGHGKVKRLFGTGAGLIFKGSGFYITDYRSDSYKEAAKKEAPAAPIGGEKPAKPKEAAKGPSPAQTKKTDNKPAKEAGS
jgi:putative FmdB family regulatory protein